MRHLGGKPLVQWTINLAKSLPYPTWLSTDDEQIAAHAVGQVDTQMITDHSAHDSEAKPRTDYDINWVRQLLPVADCHVFVILRPTSPFRTRGMVEHALQCFFDVGPDSLRAVSPVKQTPYKMWTGYQDHSSPTNFIRPLIDQTGMETPYHDSPTQTHPAVYIQNASLEIGRRDVVDRLGTISGRKVLPYWTEFPEDIDLNTEDDWRAAEEWLSTHPFP